MSDTIEIPSEAFTYTVDMVVKMRALLKMNGNEISAVYWQAQEWWPKVSAETKIHWIEQVRDNRLRFE